MAQTGDIPPVEQPADADPNAFDLDNMTVKQLIGHCRELGEPIAANAPGEEAWRRQMACQALTNVACSILEVNLINRSLGLVNALPGFIPPNWTSLPRKEGATDVRLHPSTDAGHPDSDHPDHISQTDTD